MPEATRIPSRRQDRAWLRAGGPVRSTSELYLGRQEPTRDGAEGGGGDAFTADKEPLLDRKAPRRL